MIDLSSSYPPPSTYKKPDGSSRYCFMTFVMRNDSFIPGALVFAFALRQLHTKADLLCLVTKEVTNQGRQALEILFDKIVEVDEVFVSHDRRQERQDRPYLFTRFQSLLVGSDGPFGLDYEKVVLADADVLPLASFDHLFTLNTPAGVLNESKDNCIRSNEEGVYINPFSGYETGKWIWHEIYDPVCPHGSKIPKNITDRVIYDQKNMGVNSSLWVLSPSAQMYDKIISELSHPGIRVLVGSRFNWPEMQFATLFWSGEWTNIDLRFSSFNGYPCLEILCGTHFAGYKPWNFKEMGTLSRFSRFPDYMLWHQRFKEMMNKFPSLRKIPKLVKLEFNISNLIIRYPR